jgi:hypothetical protein
MNKKIYRDLGKWFIDHDIMLDEAVSVMLRGAAVGTGIIANDEGDLENGIELAVEVFRQTAFDAYKIKCKEGEVTPWLKN